VEFTRLLPVPLSVRLSVAGPRVEPSFCRAAVCSGKPQVFLPSEPKCPYYVLHFFSDDHIMSLYFCAREEADKGLLEGSLARSDKIVCVISTLSFERVDMVSVSHLGVSCFIEPGSVRPRNV